MKAIGEDTKIRLGLVVTMLAGIVWLTSLKADTIALKEKFETIERAQSLYLNMQEEVRDRLSRIEGMLKRQMND